MINHTIGERIRVFRFDNVMTCEELAAAVELCLLMSQISEQEYCAGWINGNEYFIWSKMQGKGGCDLTESEIAKLRTLADAAGGWWIWRGKAPELVPMAEWLEMYAAGEVRR